MSTGIGRKLNNCRSTGTFHDFVELQNPAQDTTELHKICRSPVLVALKLCKGQSGTVLLYRICSLLASMRRKLQRRRGRRRRRGSESIKIFNYGLISIFKEPLAYGSLEMREAGSDGTVHNSRASNTRRSTFLNDVKFVNRRILEL